MFDLDVSKMLVVGVVALIVIGPKDLPRVLRTVGQTVGRMRRMAAEFQNQFNEAIKEADLEDVKKEFSAIRDSANIDTSFDAASIMREEITAAVEGPKEIGHSTIDLTGTGPAKETEPPASAETAPQELISLSPADAVEPPKETPFSPADLTGTGPIAPIEHAEPSATLQPLLSLTEAPAEPEVVHGPPAPEPVAHAEARESEPARQTGALARQSGELA
jgi:sec-independent protein translocase protein TatB